MPDYRTLSITFDDEHRLCSCCRKSLAHQNDTIFIMVPSMDRVFEFCKWACLMKYVAKILQDKARDLMLQKNDLLSKLGADRKWGKRPTKAELERPITDSIEDIADEQPKRTSRRPAGRD